MDYCQRTLARKVEFRGKGLHSGRIVRMEVEPAANNHGIVFQRSDSCESIPVKAIATNISSTDLCTTIGTGRNSVATIEHVMGALYGLGIDNAFIRIDAPEVPIMDGSAAPFVHGFLKAGFGRQDFTRRLYEIKRPLEVRSGDKFIKVTPAKNLEILCAIDFGNSLIGRQSIHYVANPENFVTVSHARTFCHINDVNYMRSQGLALGGSLENAVVVTDSGIMNEEGLRADDEFVRHKLLDLIGDLSLLGGQLLGRIEAHKPGHTLHAEFMHELLGNPTRYLEILDPVPYVGKVQEHLDRFMVQAIATYG